MNEIFNESCLFDGKKEKKKNEKRIYFRIIFDQAKPFEF